MRIEGNWLRGLATVLAAGYVAMGIAAGGLLAALAVAGAFAIVAALLATSLSARARLFVLLLGALPFAVAAWWSVAAPLSGLVIILLGALAIRGDVRHATQG